MKLLHTIVDGETVVVDLTTGTILGTNLMALLTANDTFGHLAEAQQFLDTANEARRDGDTSMERDYLRDVVDSLTCLLANTGLELTED